MSDFWHRAAKGAAQVGGFVAKGMADGVDIGHRKLERMLKNGEYERLTPSQRRKFDEVYNAYNPEATAALKAAGERWEKWGRGERD